MFTGLLASAMGAGLLPAGGKSRCMVRSICLFALIAAMLLRFAGTFR